MTDIRAWKLRPRPDDKTVQENLTTRKVRLGYKRSGLFLDTIWDDLVKMIRIHNPNRSDKGAAARIGKLSTLFGIVKKGASRSSPEIRGNP